MSLEPEALSAGDEVEFIRDTDPNVPLLVPFQQPSVPKGARATVTSVHRDYVLVKLDDAALWPGEVTLWREGVVSAAFTNTVGALRRR